jgi:hypothetical protein
MRRGRVCGSVWVKGGADLAEEAMSQAKVACRRLNFVRAVERAAVVERPVVCKGPLYLVHPTIAAACAGSLRRIAVLLRDESHPVDASALDALQAFIRDGASSFFGRDVASARREAALLEHLVETGQSGLPAARVFDRSPRERSPLRVADADRVRSRHRSGSRVDGGRAPRGLPGVPAAGVQGVLAVSVVSGFRRVGRASRRRRR